MIMKSCADAAIPTWFARTKSPDLFRDANRPGKRACRPNQGLRTRYFKKNDYLGHGPFAFIESRRMQDMINRGVSTTWQRIQGPGKHKR